jgi:DNA helicase HerA-like ATPase
VTVGEPPAETPDPQVGRAAEAYRSLRRQLETDVLSLATSLDGRRFTLQSSLHSLPASIGGYVVLETADGPRLGQVLSLVEVRVPGPEIESGDDGHRMRAAVTLRAAEGDGELLDSGGGPFHDAQVRAARPEEVAAWLQAARPPRAGLDVGELALAPGVDLSLDAGGFDRHTFLCGQSGSGKTYSLGLLLERLLMATDLRVVVLDPNSDHVRLGEVRPGAPDELRSRHDRVKAAVAVRRQGGDGTDALRLRIADLDPTARAGVLALDPIGDREEYALLDSVFEQATAADATTTLDDALAADTPEARALLLRARNLGVDRWAVWSRGRGRTVVDDLRDDANRCLVVDLGSLETRGEQAAVAEAVLSTLWDRRGERQPVLLVIDEAHNVCPQDPQDPVTAAATELAVRIAGEGRKYGIYLLVVTQRPQKVHQNVISQCDNLVLMRMNSRSDLALVREVFSFVPGALVDAATTFRQGEALVAGKLASHPVLLRFGARASEEGGADVPSTWASPAGTI